MNDSKFLFIEKMFLTFLIASFTGWLYEVVTMYVMWGHYIDRGVLYLPMCPIYGFGMLMLYALFHKVKNPFALFLCSSLLTTGFELVSSYILEYGFNQVLWTYEPWPFNFQGRISLISSVIFGLLALYVFKGIIPLLDFIYKKVSNKIIHVITILITVLCVVIQGMNMFMKG